MQRHFCYVQRLSDGRADRRDSYYYEREWRLGEQTLVPEAKLQRPNANTTHSKRGTRLTQDDSLRRTVRATSHLTTMTLPSWLFREIAGIRSRTRTDYP